MELGCYSHGVGVFVHLIPSVFGGLFYLELENKGIEGRRTCCFVSLIFFGFIVFYLHLSYIFNLHLNNK